MIPSPCAKADKFSTTWPQVGQGLPDWVGCGHNNLIMIDYMNLMVGPRAPHRLCLKISLIIYFVGVLTLQHKPKPKPKSKHVDVG